TGISFTSPPRGSSSAVPRPHVERSLCRRGARNGFVPRHLLRATASARCAPGDGLGGSQRRPLWSRHVSRFLGSWQPHMMFGGAIEVASVLMYSARKHPSTHTRSHSALGI